MDQITYWDRQRQKEQTEQVYGEGFVRWLYCTPTGNKLSEGVLSRAFFSQAYGAYQSSSLSRHKIAGFIRDFSIPMEEFEPGPFRSFNDFFIRRFKPGVRQITAKFEEMPACAEGRWLAFDQVRPESVFPVKGASLSAAALLGSAEKAKPFLGGSLLLIRLCPTDYHRFHYPDDGTTLESYRVAGRLHSVNPLALRYKSEIFATNERHVSILETKNFGKLAYIEVGAMCVGRIVQSHPSEKSFRRGDEKGYFLFGGSTVIVLGEPGRWKPDADLIAQTQARRETLVRLGERVATSITASRV